MRTGLILFVTCAPWGMWTPGREGLGINTSIVFMGCSQPSRLAPERAPFVEAGRDIRFQHPRIRAGSQEVDLGNGVLGAPFGAEPVRTRVKLRLKNRLDHQLQQGLNDPVTSGSDTKHSELSVWLGYQPLAHGHGLKRTGFELGSQP